MASLPPLPVLTLSLLWAALISPSVSQTCSSQTFTNNAVYAHCLDLPSLASFFHFTYNSTNSTLSLAFTATPPTSSGWIAWALNPTAPQMVGSQALVAYKNSSSSSSSVTVKFYNVISYSSVIPTRNLSFDVWDARAEEVSSGGQLRIVAKIKVPDGMAAKGTVNHVWQVGPGVGSGGALTPHAFNPANLAAKATLDLNGGGSTTVGGGSNSRLKKKNIHGVLNAVSWGVLLPLGVIIARYVRAFPSADPAWFYMHVLCQVSGYAIGVAGWSTGIQLGSQSKGIQYTGHRNIGISLFAVATLQIFALFLRPKNDHKYRLYWNIYHHGVGYAIVILGILNVFKGFDILQPEHKWRLTYIVVIAALGGIAVLLEAITWIVVLRRKRSDQSTKPYDSYNGQGRQQPLTAA